MRRPRWSRLVGAATFLLTGLLPGLFTGVAHALVVQVDAPEALTPLLEQHLDAARAARLAEPLSDSEIERLQQASEKTARELLATEGYFSPTVRVTRDGERLRFVVEPGPRVEVRTVEVTVIGAAVIGAAVDDATPAPTEAEKTVAEKTVAEKTVAEKTEVAKTGAAKSGAAPGDADSAPDAARLARLAERIKATLPLAPGMPFRQADWDASKTAALRPFAGGTFAAARIASSEARIDPDAHTAQLTITVDPGPRFLLGDINVNGAERYPAELVRRYSPLTAGKRYRQQDMLDYQTALEASGYYASAAVRITPDPAQAGAVPIEVDVIERPTHLASVGVGVSSDTGPRIQGEYQHRSINGHGMRLKLDARIETEQQQTGAEIALPRDRNGYDHAFGVRQQFEDLNGQETRTSSVSARRTRTRGNIETTLSTIYQTEEQTVGTTVDSSNQALTLNYQWTQRTVGRGFYPGRGYVLTLGIGGALEQVLSDTSFLRLYARHTQYFSVGEKGRLVVRGELGSVLADTRDGIPTDSLFRAGGDNSVRGYGYQSLGEPIDGGVASVRQLATASAEYQYFFLRDWGAAVFVDAGDAADDFAALDPVVGVGVGARYRSPVGPINLDLAYGEAVGEFRVHFSLGVTF